MAKGIKYSKNKRAGKIMGLRPKGIPFDSPAELGYTCPKCKNDPMFYESKSDQLLFDDRLHWSEYKGFIWCECCNKDFPSPLCMPDIDEAIEIFLDIVEGIKNGK